MGALTVLFNRIRQVPSARLLGRTSSGTGACESLTAEQVRTLLSLYSVAQIDSALSGKVGTDDARLSNAREPTSHGHTQSDITGLDSALAGKVGTSDARLSDARTPTAHSHAQSDITGLATALAAVVDTAASLDQVFAETITWTGTTAPSGTATTRYSWTRVGKLVFFEFRFHWTTAGTSLTAAQWQLPAGFPTPANMTGQDAGEIYSFVSGGAGAGSLGGVVLGSVLEARLQLDGSGNPQVRLRFSTGVGAMNASGVYRCA
jgi:hypothetical protein